jgi:hypothetical protein
MRARARPGRTGRDRSAAKQGAQAAAGNPNRAGEEEAKPPHHPPAVTRNLAVAAVGAS